MSNEIKYSVIIPHFNDIDGLNNLIKSIPESKDIQVIIVDDNSDMLLDDILLSKYCELYVNNSEIKGAGTCRNIGLEKALGKWVIFSDSDDFFVENAFEIFGKYFEDESDIIYFKVTSTFKNTDKTSDRHIHINQLVDKLIDNKCNDICYLSSVPWGKMIRKDFLNHNNLRFDEVIVANDIMFSLKVGYLANNVKGVCNYVYNVTRSDGSLTSTKKNEYLKVRVDKFLEYNQYLYLIEKKEYQVSLITLIIRYRKVVNRQQLLKLLSDLFKGRQKLLPNKLFSTNFFGKLFSVVTNKAI